MGYVNYVSYIFVIFFLRRSVELNSNFLEFYENIMESFLGFVNLGVVEFFLGKLGIDEFNLLFLMRGL